MLMDEPFSGLDNRLRDDIRDETLALLKAEDTAVVWSPMNRMRRCAWPMKSHRYARPIVQRNALYL